MGDECLDKSEEVKSNVRHPVSFARGLGRTYSTENKILKWSPFTEEQDWGSKHEEFHASQSWQHINHDCHKRVTRESVHFRHPRIVLNNGGCGQDSDNSAFLKLPPGNANAQPSEQKYFGGVGEANSKTNHPQK